MSRAERQAGTAVSDPGPPTSPTLLSRLRVWDDTTAWNLFSEQYGKLLRQWGHSKLKDADEVEEVRQLVLWEAARRLVGFQYNRRQSFRGWLRTLFQSRLLDFLKQKRRRTQRERDFAIVQRPSLEMSSGLSESTETTNPQRRVERARQQSRIDAAMLSVRERVTDKTWTIFWEIAVENQPIASVAAQHEMKYASAFAAFSRVSRMLREEAQGTSAS